MKATVPGVLHIATWNLEDGRAPSAVAADVRAMLAEVGRVHVVVFQESRRYHDALRQVADAKGYRFIHATGWREAGNCSVIVRNDVPLRRWSVLRMVLGWFGPHKGNHHVGRTFLTVDLGGFRDPNKTRIVDVHMPPGGPTGGVVTHGRNKPAYDEAATALISLANERSSKRRRFVMLGDFNASANDHHATAPFSIAQEIAGQLITAGGGVDLAVVRGAEAKGHKGTNHGSDHPYRVFTIQ